MRRLSMVRLSALALATLAVACTGEIVDPSGNAAKAAAAAFKSDVEPTLTSKCGVCHTGTAFPQFMRPDPTLRDGILCTTKSFKFRNSSTVRSIFGIDCLWCI